MVPEILQSYPSLFQWVKSCIELTRPSSVYVFLDPVADDKRYTHKLLVSGALRPLKNPDSYHITTDPEDTARVEDCTYICTRDPKLAGKTNNWQDPDLMMAHLESLFRDCMQGREMIIIPYCMGPLDSPYKILGVEITDSAYVAISMRRMARVGLDALKLFDHHQFSTGLHSVGRPLAKDEKDVLWPCSPSKRVIAHFPESGSIYSYGSGYGGNALLGKKCLSLRIASYEGYKKGFLAEHMLIMGLENPQGVKKYILGAFPSACGKTNLAMLESKLPGWKVTCIGDDIAWIHLDENGCFRAINPEFGFFGVAPGTSWSSNPEAMRIMSKDTLFTNTGYTESGEVYWEGLDKTIPEGLMTWKNRPYDGSEKAAHPNSRFTSPLENCTRLDPYYSDPKGVKIEAIIFGGRRQEAVPLVAKSFDFQHGVFMGASLSSETTAASSGDVGKVRQDPFAMLPFCGYNITYYFKHWLDMGKKAQVPLIFQVNWFRKNSQGHFAWPGFVENIRVLKWIFEACEGRVKGKVTPWGIIPSESELLLDGLDVNYADLFSYDEQEYKKEKQRIRAFFASLGEDMPQCLLSYV